MGIKISKDHLHPSVIESITSLIGDLSQLETTAKGNAVEAINELLANGGNKEELEALIAEIAEGKELIANAVGEPLTAEESFDEMSNDINGLLSTFKTNMMNNGVTVESGDKFKSLIDKITTMVEEGEGKGMQFASHVYSTTFGEFPTAYHTGHTGTLTINTNLNFTPTYVFCKIYAYAYDSYQHDTINATISNIAALSCSEYTIEIKNITPESFDVVYPKEVSSTEHTEVYVREWYAIGVGEEDTTLRDSLASILENKGVDITEEDDMASLITKVDEEFENKNANKGCIISANDIDDKGVLVTLQENSSSVYVTSKEFITIRSWTSKISGSVNVNVGLEDGVSGASIIYCRLEIVSSNGSTRYSEEVSETGTNVVQHNIICDINVGDVVNIQCRTDYLGVFFDNFKITTYLIQQ